MPMPSIEYFLAYERQDLFLLSFKTNIFDLSIFSIFLSVKKIHVVT